MSARTEKATRSSSTLSWPVTVDCDGLTDSDAELKIVILTAAADTEDETKLRLAAVAGVRDSVLS